MGVFDWIAVVSYAATIFALIVGMFSAYNGRRTRSDIGKLIQETTGCTQELIRESSARAQEMIREISARTQELMRESSARTQEMIRESSARTQELILESSTHNRELIQTTHARTLDILERMDQRLEAQQSLLATMGQRLNGLGSILERQELLLERLAARQDDIFNLFRQTRS